MLRHLSDRNVRFSIRFLLLGTAACAVALATIGIQIQEAWRQRIALAHLAQVGGYVVHDRPNWLGERFGFDPFAKVHRMDVFGNGVVPVLVQYEREFPELQGLMFGADVTDVGFDWIPKLRVFPKLDTADFLDSALTDAGMRRVGDWENLRVLNLNGCADITDDGLSHLVKLNNLEKLMFIAEGSGTLNISDAGLKHVGQMSRLRILYLVGIPVTDQGLKHLRQLDNLELILIRRTQVTDEGIVALQSALPDCRINPKKPWGLER
jgi:hypothetical protein